MTGSGTVNQKEILASMRVLVCMAMADGQLLEEERAGLVDALKELPLPEGITVDALLAEIVPLETLLPEITSETARNVVYQAAYTLAHIDGHCCPEEQKLLDRIASAYSGFKPFGKQAWLEDLEHRADRLSLAKQMQKLSDSGQREIEVDQLITDTCFFNAIFGTFPFPGFAIPLDILIYLNQLDLVQTIGERWGYTRCNEDLRKALFGSLAVTGARIAFSNLAKLIPVAGMVAGAATAYAMTWAIGRVANQYYASGGQMDTFGLREAFRKAKQEGTQSYQQNAASIATWSQTLQPQIEALGADLQQGKITEEEYQVKMQELTLKTLTVGH